MFVGKIFFKMATPSRTHRIAQGPVVQQPGQRGFGNRQPPRKIGYELLAAAPYR